MGGTGQGRCLVRQCPVSLLTNFGYENLNTSQAVRSRSLLSRYFTGRGTRHPRPVPPGPFYLPLSGNHGDRGATGMGLFLPALDQPGQAVEPRSPWSPERCSGYSFSNHHGRKYLSGQMGGTGQGRCLVRQCPVILPTGFRYETKEKEFDASQFEFSR